MHSGFQGYVDRSASVPVIARVTTGSTEEVLPVILPPLPALPESQDPGLFARFVACINGSGTLVEIGSNLGHPMSLSQRRFFGPTVRYWVSTFTPIPTPMLSWMPTTSARRSSRVRCRASSHSRCWNISAAPWIVAIEINRVLAPGGLVYHQSVANMNAIRKRSPLPCSPAPRR